MRGQKQQFSSFFEDDEIETVLLINPENVFNFINREVMLQNISIMCPIISTFISNCYYVPARLFITRNEEAISREGTKQGDLTSMGTYVLGVTPLLRFLQEFVMVNKQIIKEVAFGEEFTVTGKVDEIKSY